MTTTGAIVFVFAAFVGFEVLPVWGGRCGCDWKEFNGNCYYLSETHRYWFEARWDCKQRGGDLAVIPDQATNEFIMGMKNEKDSIGLVWIGLRDFKGNRNFTWVDNQEHFYTNWHDGDPKGTQNFRFDRCVAVNIGDDAYDRGKWSDLWCYEPGDIYHVCQRDLGDDYFKCSDGNYISNKLVCDRIVDCSDVGDELNCDF